ncbi:MAG TPA: hypothetical protein VF482_17325 [Trebonia sp.]
MNDDEMLATLRSSLTGAKESLTDVHLDRSADAIRARARGRRLRRGLAGVGAGGIALGVGLALAVGGGSGTNARSVHVNLDAWSVNTLSSGRVYVDVREMRDPVLLRQTLARAGVPAIVTFGEICTQTSGGDAGNPQRVLGKTVLGGEPKLTINPAAIPAGSELSIGIVSVSKAGTRGLDASFTLVKEGSRLTCGSPRTEPGAGEGEKGPGAPRRTGTVKTGFAG